MRRATRVAGVLNVCCIAVVTALVLIIRPASPSCPPGYGIDDEHPGICMSDKHPEPFFEVQWRQRQLTAMRSAPFAHVLPGAFAAAVNQGEQMKKAPKIKGAGGFWEPYGQGPLVVNDESTPRVNGLGLVDVMGRIDDLEYDPATNRLFAALGTGGVWLSEDVGTTWRSIGDRLPSQIIGAVAWSRANGGTVIASSGDPTFGSITGYTGYGAFYTNDLGATWKKATGVPDGALSFKVAVDPSNPNVVYVATMVGLYRSADGGRSYVNVNLPTGACAGVAGGLTTGRPECQLANVVTDVVVKAPGGVNSNANVPTGTVLAAVGWRGGQKTFQAGGTTYQQAPSNGLYRSGNGAPGSFTKVQVGTPTGFTPQERIGRIELGSVTGPAQDHDIVYAIVQDAVTVNGGFEFADAPDVIKDPRGTAGTNLHGLYYSADFGNTWLQIADDSAIAKYPASGSALVGTGQAQFYEPGVQAWYNEYIAPDPTRQDSAGVPTRVVFGLEEIWQNELTTVGVNTPTLYKVIGRYFSGGSCLFLNLGVPECPAHRPPTVSTTTHPDQHDAVWIPRVGGGVTLAVSNDGGFYKNTVLAGQELDNGGWGNGNQAGFNTLLPYDLAAASDGTVYAGLQDNGHLKIRASDRKQFMTYGGDGTWAAVDPNNSNIAYQALPGGDMNVTTDGGTSWTNIAPPITNARFVNPFEMDPFDSNHIVTAGRQIVETIHGPMTGTELLGDDDWAVVFDLGTVAAPGVAPSATEDQSPTMPHNAMTAIAVMGPAVYAGYCGVCDILNQSYPFKSGLATNVGGELAPKTKTSDGWHLATAAGLPNRYITSIAIDPNNPRTIFVALAGYSRRWIPPGSLNDANTNVGEGHVFKSTDAGETFVDISGNLPDAPVTWITQRGPQLLVATDVGVFASDSRGGTRESTWGPLVGLPNVPVVSMQLAPNDVNLLYVAAYGRGIWTFRFAESIPGLTPIGGPAPTVCSTPAGGTLAGPFGFESALDGWTPSFGLSAAPSGLPTSTWRPALQGHSGLFSAQVMPYMDSGDARLTSPAINHTGGCVFVSWWNTRDLEDGFDVMTVEWSSDNSRWTTVATFTGKNTGNPGYSQERVGFGAPAGPLFVRFRVVSDMLLSAPLYLGVAIDDVTIGR
jgi:hypothetical protein